MLHGFTMTVGNKLLFYVTDGVNKSPSVINTFIDKLGEVNNLSPSFVERCKQDNDLRDRLKREIAKATLEIKGSGDWQYYNICGKCFNQSIPVKEADGCVFIFGGDGDAEVK